MSTDKVFCRRNRAIGVLVAAALLLVLSPSSALAVNVVPHQVTSGSGMNVGMPLIGGTGGNYIAYAWNNGTDQDVRLYDIAAGTTQVIASGVGDQYPSDISGDWLLYVSSSGLPMQLYAYNVVTHVTRSIAALPTYETGVGIDGSRIVYISNRSLHLYDLNTLSDTVLVTTPGLQMTQCQISGKHVIWWCDAPGSTGIVFYDLDTMIGPQNMNIGVFVWSGDVDNGRIVYWSTSGSGGMGVYAYDIASQAVRYIGPSATTGAQPKIGGNYVVWTDAASDWSVATANVYDLSDGSTRALPASAGWSQARYVQGTRAVWLSSSESPMTNLDLYWGELGSPPPPTATPASSRWSLALLAWMGAVAVAVTLRRRTTLVRAA